MHKQKELSLLPLISSKTLLPDVKIESQEPKESTITSFVKSTEEMLEKSDFEDMEIGDPDESYITSDATLSDEKLEIENSDLYCKICKISFSKIGTFNSHNIETHGERNNTVHTVRSGRFVRAIRSGRFVRSKSLKINQNQVHETNMPECHLCKDKFTRIQSLNDHLKNRKWFYLFQATYHLESFFRVSLGKILKICH
jgi:hypothetical protein